MSLIKEFAIEPEVMADWNHFRELRSDFGVGRGRLISIFPWNWKQLVERALDPSNPMRAYTIRSMLHSYLYGGDHKFLRTGRSFSGVKSWQENAEESVLPGPFHAIIARCNPRNHTAVLVAGQFDNTKAPYDVRTQLDVPRLPDELADCCGVLLENCEEFRIVDPHFNLSNRGFPSTLNALLDRLGAGQRKLRRIELHIACPDLFDESVQRANFSRTFERQLITANTMRLVFWRDLPEGFHARYLLTEIGGVKFDWGFDQGNSPQHINEVLLLEHARFQEISNRFTAPAALPSPSCEIIEIRGQRARPA